MKCMSATFPERLTRSRRANGFAAVAAIFVLVVLGGLGVVLVTVFGSQQRSSAFDWLGTQAYQAARAGIEYGSYQALTSGICAANTPLVLPGSLASFRVTVTCAATVHTEGGATVTTYELASTACNRAACPSAAPDATYVEREVRATVGTAP